MADRFWLRRAQELPIRHSSHDRRINAGCASKLAPHIRGNDFDVLTHLTCRACETSVEVEGRAVERWVEGVARDAGFTEVGHTVELFGAVPRLRAVSARC